MLNDLIRHLIGRQLAHECVCPGCWLLTCLLACLQGIQLQLREEYGAAELPQYSDKVGTAAGLGFRAGAWPTRRLELVQSWGGVETR